MAFTYTAEQDQLRELVRRACGAEARNRVANEGGPAGDPELWTILRDAGLLAIGVAQDRGGAGGSIVDQAVIARELGRVASPAPFVTSTMMAGRLLQAAAEPHPLVAAMADGATITCVIEKPAQRTMTLGADAPRVSGMARMVMDGPEADHLLVGAVTSDRAVVGVVDPTHATVERVAHPTLDRGRPVATVIFEDAPIELLAEPAQPEVAPGEHGYWGDVIGAALHVGAVGLAAESSGLAQRCLELARDYALTRRQFGEIIGQFQAVKHHLADMLVLAENAHAAVQLGAFALDGNGDDVDLSVAAAKAAATDAAVRVAGLAMQIHGGISITWEHDLHLYLRRAKTNQHLLGEPTIHREAIAERLLSAAQAG